MISHVFVGVNNFEKAYKFYSAIMEEMELRLKFCDSKKPWAAWNPISAPRPLFIIGSPFDNTLASIGNGQMIALLASSVDMVNRTYERALSLGGRCEGPPGLRPHYHDNYYGAYFRDLDGNKLCVCVHDAK